MKRLLLFALLSFPGFSQQNAVMLPWTPQQFTNTNGALLVSGKVCTYLAGTSTGTATFTDATASVQNAIPPNAILLDSTARPTSGGIWLTPNKAYKIITMTAGSDGTCNTGVVVKTQDNITLGANTATSNTFTGTNTFLGLLNCKNLEGVRCVDPGNSQGWPGTTADSWINSATAALPTIAGGLHKGTVYIADGAYSLAATVNANGPVTYLCNKGKATLTWTVNNIDGFTLSGGSGIYGCNLIGTFDTAGGHVARGINSGYTAWSNAATENSSAVYSPTFANANGHQYNPSPNNCVTAGAEPIWPLNPGGTVVDNTCTWTEDGITDITIQDNYIAGWGSKVLGATGAAINTGSNSYGWKVVNNRVENNGNEGMLIGNLSQNMTVRGNIFQYNFFNGLDINGRNNTVEDNQFLSNAIGRTCGTTDQNGVTIVGITGGFASNNTLKGNIARLNQGGGFYLAENGGNAENNDIETNVADGNSNGCTSGYAGFQMTEVSNGTFRNNRMVGNVSINHTAVGAFGMICNLNGGTGTYLNNQCAPNTLSNNTTNYSTTGQGTGSNYGLRTQFDGLAFEHSTGGGFTNLVPSGASFFQINPPGGSSYQFFGGSPGELILPGGAEAIFTEGATAGGNGAGQDTCYGDSNAHSLKCSFNNSAFGPLVTAAPCTTSQRTESAADSNLLTCAIPAQAGSYRIRFMMNVSATNTATIGWTATYTDSNGVAQTPANLALVAVGSATWGLIANGNNDYYGYADIDVNNSGTAIVVKVTFSGTSFTAKCSATVERII